MYKVLVVNWLSAKTIRTSIVICGQKESVALKDLF